MGKEGKKEGREGEREGRKAGKMCGGGREGYQSAGIDGANSTQVTLPPIGGNEP
jgi:hypothetical protein